MRARVTSLAGVLFAVVLLVASVALVVTLRQLRLAGVDDNLRIRADDVDSLLAADGALTPGSLGSVTDTVAQVVDRSGEVIAASHAAIDGAPVAPGVERETISESSDLAVDDDRFRILSRPGAGGVTIHVAQSIDDVDEAQAILVATLAVLVPAVTLVLIVGVWVLVGRTLEPVESIRAEVDSIGAGRLDRRVPVPRGSDEIARLARTMNEMLDRVQNAHDRQRQFAADASHELRGPLTRIRTELEVELAHPARTDPADVHRSVLDEVAVLQRTIDDLLLLARSEQTDRSRWRPVDLDDLVLREVEEVRAAGLTLHAGDVSAAQVIGDEFQLARVVRNLIENAVRHASSEVTISLREAGGEAVLRVADDGGGIDAADRDRIFERFTRLDPARTAGSGAGLGLAIVREIVERHRGTAHLDGSVPGGACFEIRIPAAAGRSVD